MSGGVIMPFFRDHRILACSAASVAVHGAVGAALFLGFGIAISKAAQPAAQMVVELAPLPSAPPEPPNLAPPQPEQKKAEPKPVVAKLDVPPLKVALNTPPAVVVPKADPRPEKVERNDKPAEQTTQAAAPEAPHRDVAKAASIGAPSSAVSNAQQTWESRLLALLERKKRYPGAAQSQGQQDVVYVRMSINASGQLVNGEIRRSLGFPLLDGEVMSLIRRASPFPAPPSDVMNGKPVVTLLVPVEFFIKKTRQAG